ncbi:alpha/beta hydrolase [Aureococcus anophagefferens]|nr:alpha/beta hydrolase [Aureococcus anophagefferens]
MCALRIAVTGTAGRLGGSIARACRAAGQEVAATLDRAPGADVSHVADLSADGRHTWASAFEGVDVVIHAAALPGRARAAADRARAAARVRRRVRAGRTVDVAYGYSMGAMQALALARGGGVAAVVAVCGAAGCSDYNRVFLDALDAALEGGDRSVALRAFALVYAGWGVSYDFYAERAWARLGFEDLDDFLERSYVAGFATDDPDDLRAMLACWRAAAERPPGLEAIEARCLFLPCDTDAPPGVQRSRRLSRAFENHEKVVTDAPGRRTSSGRDRRARSRHPRATLRTIRSPFGHRAGDPWRDGMDAERAFIRAELGLGAERGGRWRRRGASEFDSLVSRLDTWDARLRERLDAAFATRDARTTAALESYLGSKGGSRRRSTAFA